MKAWLNPFPYIKVSACLRWCKYLGDISSAQFGPAVPSERHLNTTVYLSVVADHLHPSWLLPGG